MTQQQIYRVEAGRTAHLSCSVDRLGQFVVMWKQGGRVISAGSLLVRKDDRFRLQLSGDNNFDLEIEDIGVEDSSEYQCEVDILGRSISIIHRLEVMVAPQVSKRVVCFTVGCSGASQEEQSQAEERSELQTEVFCPWTTKSKDCLDKEGEVVCSNEIVY